jgi:hypothetical protein
LPASCCSHHRPQLAAHLAGCPRVISTANSSSSLFFLFSFWFDKIRGKLEMVWIWLPCVWERGDGWSVDGSRSLTWALIQGGPRASGAGCFHFLFFSPFHALNLLLV